MLFSDAGLLLQKKIQKNRERLERAEYQIDNLFQKSEYGWPGDWEGRALLAFCRHYSITGIKMPCMEKMLDLLPEKTNKYGYLGQITNGDIADEQQLSGHSWYLCGLVEYYRLTGDEKALRMAESTVEHLYLPVLPRYDGYPLQRNKVGGVSGEVTGIEQGWKLSSDVGCAFMCVDGLSRYYALTKDERAYTFLKRCIEVFAGIDFVKYGFQTHTTLSCARGILSFYQATGEKEYLRLAVRVMERYIEHGMTLTYENFNWFGREDTWTEPCAVVDSLLLAVNLYKETGETAYKTLARRIWFNGLSFCQIINGGAGPNTCVTLAQPNLAISMYEAPFCCTMRFAEGLQCAYENPFVYEEQEEKIVKDTQGRYFAGDKILVEPLNGWDVNGKTYEVDGRTLIAIPTLVPKQDSKFRVVFG